MDAPASTAHSSSQPQRRFGYALLLYSAFVAVVAVANGLASRAGGDEESPMMMVAGMLLGFLAIPVLSVALPLWLSRRWDLPRSWWPPRGHLAISLAVVALFVLIGNYSAIETLIEADVSWSRFVLHFIGSMLFHVPYYPLFAILLFTTGRAWRGTAFSIVITSVLFSLYHLAHFHFFPAGTEPFFLFLLFAVFCWHLLLYLFTRSLVLVAFVHSVGGAVAMAAEGTYHDGADFLFFLTIIIVSGVFVYGIFDQRYLGRHHRLSSMSWPAVTPFGVSDNGEASQPRAIEDRPAP